MRQKIEATIVCPKCGEVIALDYQTIRKVVNAYSVAMGSRSGKNMTAHQRAERGKKAALTRWQRMKATQDTAPKDDK